MEYMNIVKQIEKLEKKFSRNLYNGGGKMPFVIHAGQIPIMVSAPHAINQYREGSVKYADKFTGGLAMFLHKMTQCHVIYSTKYSGVDPNYDDNTNDTNLYQTTLREYIKNHNICVLIDLHGASKDKEYAVEMGTAPIRDANGLVTNEDYSLNGYPFIAKLIKYAFEFFFRDCAIEKKAVWKNVIFDAGKQNTVTKYISENTGCSCIQLEINGHYRDITRPIELTRLIEGLEYIIGTLSNIDWNAKQIDVFRLWQSNIHKPQDKVLYCPHVSSQTNFRTNSLLFICSSLGEPELVRLSEANERLIQDLNNGLQDDGIDIQEELKYEYLFLTNRLIEQLFNREWLQGVETKPYLRRLPIVLYENNEDSYNVGLPKADKIDRVYFSTELYNSKLVESEKFNFIIFNRYTDSRLNIDFLGVNYQDNGRVRDYNGSPAKKVMLPRYYKRLLGYLDKPLIVIREEEFLSLKVQIEKKVSDCLRDMYCKSGTCYVLARSNNAFTSLLKKIGYNQDLNNNLSEEEYNTLRKELIIYIQNPLVSSYKKIVGEAFYKLEIEKSDTRNFEKTTSIIFEIQKFWGLYDKIEILRVLKEKDQTSILQQAIAFINKIIDWIIEKFIGKVEYSLRAEWTSETDDSNNVARLSPSMMSLLGIAENDKILIRYGDSKEILRVLSCENLLDYEIGIPAPTRKKMGMNSINDIVVVCRDIRHAFKRHSLEQTIAIIGVIFAVFQFTDDIQYGIISCLILIPLVLYFILNEERIKVQ